MECSAIKNEGLDEVSDSDDNDFDEQTYSDFQRGCDGNLPSEQYEPRGCVQRKEKVNEVHEVLGPVDTVKYTWPCLESVGLQSNCKNLILTTFVNKTLRPAVLHKFIDTIKDFHGHICLSQVSEEYLENCEENSRNNGLGILILNNIYKQK